MSEPDQATAPRSRRGLLIGLAVGVVVLGGVLVLALLAGTLLFTATSGHAVDHPTPAAHHAVEAR